MQQATKQRIAGSVVLIALALIFLPIIFDGEGSYDPQISSRIPPTPIITPLEEPVPIRPVVLANQPGFQSPVESEPSESDSGEQLEDSATERPESAVPATDVEEAENTVAEVVDSQPSFERESPQLGPDGLPQGWSVRLGTFSDESNAAKLLERLLAADYKAYARDIERDQGRLTAVFVGPWLDRNRVDSYQKQLQEEFQLAGLVVRYTIDPR